MKARLPKLGIRRLRQGGAHTVKKYDRSIVKKATREEIREYKDDPTS